MFIIKPIQLYAAKPPMSAQTDPALAVGIPCRNEEATIAAVVAAFKRALPGAVIHVFDNNSTDATAEAARQAGANVWGELHPGKGNVVRRFFAEIEADVYLMVDGDDTYDAASAPGMIRLLVEQHLDMVVARRVSEDAGAYRTGHRLGNRLLTAAVSSIFGSQLKDMLSGYRVFSRRFVKSFPASSHGFEIEAELTVHALQMRLPIAEIASPYFARREGSVSKLNTWRDGMRILATILRLFSLEKPLRFYSLVALFFFLAASILFVPVLLEYFQTGLVPRYPSLIVAVGVYLAAILSVVVGIVQRTSSAARKEAKRFAYLSVRK